MLFDNTIAVVGETISEKCKSALSQMGFSVRTLPPYSRLSAPVSTHADMLMLPVGKMVFTFSEYAEENRGLFDEIRKKGFEIVYVSALPEKEYPRDVLLNCLVLGNTLLSNTRYTAAEVLDHVRKSEFNCVNVKQGYARCTACPISEKAIITADPSISRAARLHGISVLIVEKGGVILKGYDYGFIGGSCGIYKDMIFFAGDITSHPNGEEIISFCKSNEKNPFSLSDEPLYDVGSIFFF
jgi:hypothetical protein